MIPAASQTAPIRHIVMWNVIGETPSEKDEAIRVVRAEFEALRGQIPGMTRLEIGANFSRVSDACDVVLVSEFESVGALDDYANHPAHLQARERLKGLRIARYLVDYTVAVDEAP